MTRPNKLELLLREPTQDGSTCKDTMTIPRVILLIMTLLKMTLLIIASHIAFNTSDITFNDLTYNGFTYNDLTNDDFTYITLLIGLYIDNT
jgi:hypothetical protein